MDLTHSLGPFLPLGVQDTQWPGPDGSALGPGALSFNPFTETARLQNAEKASSLAAISPSGPFTDGAEGSLKARKLPGVMEQGPEEGQAGVTVEVSVQRSRNPAVVREEKGWEGGVACREEKRLPLHSCVESVPW